MHLLGPPRPSDSTGNPRLQGACTVFPVPGAPPPPPSMAYNQPPPSFREPPPGLRYGNSHVNNQPMGGQWESPMDRWSQSEPWGADPYPPTWGRNQFRDAFQDQDPDWRGPRPQSASPRYRNNQGNGGPIRGNPRNQNPRSNQMRPPAPAAQRPYERPRPTLRQSFMPYFTTIEGKFTQLCVFAAQEQTCLDPKCDKSHEPRSRRICPLFNNPKEKCPHNPCLLGHDEAQEAFKAAKAFGRCEQLA
jgi:hypothetical protein